MTLLKVEGLGKAYRQYRSEWQRFARWMGFSTQPTEERWVLRDVTFTIDPGEAVGIVGQNGAGKSTLLKLITGTVRPSEGSIEIGGRISAILELGMGFNPELTGRQNVVHSAGLLGFSAGEIEKVMPQIEAFAEIGEYFDQPVRTYSSGMQVRVAFAVATAHRPEVLIVDEALSVGDSYFQHKSFSRIREFQAQGTTLLIVSHDRGAIQALCDRAILLEKGRVIKDGNPEAVMDYYNALIADKENSRLEVNTLKTGKTQTLSGTGEATVEQICIFNESGQSAEVLCVGEKVTLSVRVRINQDIDSLVLGYGIKDRLGQVMYGINTWHTKQVIKKPIAGEAYLFQIAFDVKFGVGSYSVQTALVDRDTHLTANYEWRDLALVFDVINKDRTHFNGCVWNEPIIVIEKLDS